MTVSLAQACRRWAVAWALAVLAGGQVGVACAAQHKDPASGCAVTGPRYLASSDYTFAYQGGCKAGLAQGKGKAVWTLRSSPQNHVVWEGSFSAGVYLPPPPGIVSARAWGGTPGNSDAVVFDLGGLPAQNGIPAARLQVAATSDLTHYPDPCKPGTLWVVNAPAAAMVNDAVARSLLAAAADKLKARCGAALSETDLPGHDRAGVVVRAVATPDLEADRWGNPGPVIADAYVSRLLAARWSVMSTRLPRSSVSKNSRPRSNSRRPMNKTSVRPTRNGCAISSKPIRRRAGRRCKTSLKPRSATAAAWW